MFYAFCTAFFTYTVLTNDWIPFGFLFITVNAPTSGYTFCFTDEGAFPHGETLAFNVTRVFFRSILAH